MTVPDAGSLGEQPRLSVIIPTRNRAAVLAEALASMTHQTLSSRDFEVIVVDDGSTDDTRATAERSGIGSLRIVESAGRGLHAGRHTGLREARADIVVYADDDIEALPTWLESVLHTFEDPGVALVGGNNLPAFTEPPPAWLLRMWERPHASIAGRAIPALSVLELRGGERDIPASYVWGCNFAVRKRVVLAAGGFHPDAMPAELSHLRGDGECHLTRYVARNQLRSRFHPGASVRHKITPERMTLAYFSERGFKQGISESYTGLRAGASLSQARRARLTLHWLLMWAATPVARDSEVHRVELAYAAGLAAGYARHQRLYRANPELRAWVHKETYF